MFVLGSALLDVEKQLLTIGSRTVALQRKPYLVLLYLIENRHRMVDRKELLDRFWDGKEVYDQSLSKAVGAIRKAFGEPESTGWIETRWGLGYRYVGPFSNLPAASFEPAASTPWPLLTETQNQAAYSHSGESPAAASDEPAGSAIPASVDPNRRGVAKVSTRILVAAFLIVLLFAAVTFAAIEIIRRQKAHSHQSAALPIQSVAVLPFTTRQGDDQDQYLGLELADAVAARLGTVAQLRVRSSTTVRSIIGLAADPVAAGRRLEVQALVTGEIHRIADKVVVTVQLLDSSTGAAVWSGSFNADSSSIFSVEDSISQQVASALLPQFGMNSIKRSPGPDTTRPEAYEKYMQARFFATTRTRTSLAKAVSLLNEAIRIDPNYARAYAALADCYQLQGFYEFVPPAEGYPNAKVAALKALSLDNSLAEAHVSLLSTLSDYDRDWPGVEREFKAAIAIDPNYAVAYQYYGYALLGMGRGEQALAVMKQAALLDPVSPSIQTSLAWAYYLLRQDEQAVDQCHRILGLYPDFVPAHQLLGIVYGHMNLDQRSFAELNQSETLEKDSVITPILVDYELARSGKRDEAARRLNYLLAKTHGASVPDYYLAAVWTAIGDKQKAFAALERAVQRHSNWVIYLHYDPRFDDLRSDPKFQALLHQIDSAAPVASVQA
jgi:TolB-like protein/DNA-binding winged helix-turn-helix (wHTH) protein/tetratricopeptide (TPR) repeat protein